MEIYTKDDVRSGKNVRSYVALMVRHAKAAEFEKLV
jgi:hypothetical protein